MALQGDCKAGGGTSKRGQTYAYGRFEGKTHGRMAISEVLVVDQSSEQQERTDPRDVGEWQRKLSKEHCCLIDLE